MTGSDWISKFPGLAGLETDLRGPLIETSRIAKIPAGTQIFGPGHAPENFLLLLSGTVRVQQASDTGREIVLYRVQAGESCALTTACLMGFEEYLAEGVAETDVEAVAIPRATFDALIGASSAFRKFVFTAFSVRVSNLCKIIDDVAFSRIDIRLAHKLIELANGRAHIETTHQQIASELGTAREVISRQLLEFQRRGWVGLSRGAIEITNFTGLKGLAGMS